MDEQQDKRSVLSALMDGHASPREASDWLGQWSTDAQAREDWHLYHLIGDTLRSDALAGEPRRDEQLLQRVRAALQNEPRVLAPRQVPEVPAAARRPRRRLWTSSAAAVAGVAIVAMAYFGTRVDIEESWALVPSDAPPSSLAAADDIRRASVGSISQNPAQNPGLGAAMQADASTGPWGMPAPVAGFREILRLPRGSAQRPYEALQVLYSDGAATISVQIEPYREGEHAPRAEVGERLNTLSLQRHGAWLTLMGDVPLSTLHQFAGALQPTP